MGVCNGMSPMNVMAILIGSVGLLMIIGVWCAAVCFQRGEK